jgi:hypothetical protein
MTCGGQGYGAGYGNGYAILPGSEGRMIGVVDGLVEGSVVGAVKEGALLTGADMVRKSLRGYLNKERERR